MSMIKLLGKTKLEGKTIFATEQSPTYTITRSVSSVNEGSSVTFTLNTTNVANGTVLPYTISGISANDVTSGTLTGSFTVNSGLATTTITMSADQLTEGAETATLTLNNAAASNFVVVNDTSIFTPATISGLQLWLDASDSSTLYDATAGGSLVTTDGSAVARWQDKSGNNRHATQSTSNARPLLKTNIKNSRNILRFDGTNDFMTNGTGWNYSNYTIFAVTAPNVNINSTTTYGVFTIAQDVTIRLFLTYGGFLTSSTPDAGLTPRYTAFLDTANDPTQRECSDYESNINANQYNIATGVFSSTTGTQLFLNGAAQNTSNKTSSPSSITSAAELRLGLRFADAWGSYLNGDFCEFLIYNSVLTSQQRTNVWNYLSTKWAI